MPDVNVCRDCRCAVVPGYPWPKCRAGRYARILSAYRGDVEMGCTEPLPKEEEHERPTA